MYKLDEYQIEEIMEDYECSKKIINKIEYKLNLSGKVRNEDDYFVLACLVASQYFSIKQIVSRIDDVKDKKRRYMSLDEIVYSELQRKYDIDEEETINSGEDVVKKFLEEQAQKILYFK